MRPSPFTDNATFSRRAAIKGMATSGAVLATTWAPVGARAGRQPTPQAPSSPVPFPDTAIGREFASLIEAVNSGDPDRLPAHFTEYGPPEMAESQAAIALISVRPWGELVVHRIDGATETRLSALVEATLNEEWVTIVLERDGDLTDIMADPAEPLPGTTPVGPLDDAALAGEMARYVDKLAAADIFSGAVLVARGGEPVFTAARGLADLEAGTPNATDTRFNLGSMNKMFTSVTIGSLVEEGALAFSDTVDRHLPDYPAEVASRITIEQLLTHTSGLGDIFGPRYEREKESLHTLEDYLALFVDEPLRFEPGERHAYSNAGFIVLGLIIEAITGQDYFAAVRERVYEPAGMAATDAFERGANTPNLAIGYTIPLPQGPETEITLADALREWEPNDEFLAPRGTSAGGGYSTVEDLLAFDRALRGATLLSPETVATLIDGKVDVGAPGLRYAYGFEDDRSGAERVVGHGGGAPGISAKLDMYWDLDTTVVSLSNYDQAARFVAMKARRLIVGA